MNQEFKEGLVCGIGIGVVIVFASQFAFGFNMTEDQVREERLLPLCEMQNKLTIKLDSQIVNSTCFNFYGGPVI